MKKMIFATGFVALLAMNGASAVTVVESSSTTQDNNVTMTTPHGEVPVPATLALVAIGALALLLGRRR